MLWAKLLCFARFVLLRRRTQRQRDAQRTAALTEAKQKVCGVWCERVVRYDAVG